MRYCNTIIEITKIINNINKIQIIILIIENI